MDVDWRWLFVITEPPLEKVKRHLLRGWSQIGTNIPRPPESPRMIRNKVLAGSPMQMQMQRNQTLVCPRNFSQPKMFVLITLVIFHAEIWWVIISFLIQCKNTQLVTSQDVTPVVSEPEVKAEEKPITQKKPRPVKRPSKQEQSQPTQPPENAPWEPRRRALNGNTVRVSDLPEFTEVDSKWRKVFIPSLYNAFFCSSAPFKEFVVGSTRFIRIVQEVVDCVYPEVKYTVKRDDAIHLIVSRVLPLRDSIN